MGYLGLAGSEVEDSRFSMVEASVLGGASAAPRGTPVWCIGRSLGRSTRAMLWSGAGERGCRVYSSLLYAALTSGWVACFLRHGIQKALTAKPGKLALLPKCQAAITMSSVTAVHSGYHAAEMGNLVMPKRVYIAQVLASSCARPKAK